MKSEHNRSESLYRYCKLLDSNLVINQRFQGFLYLTNYGSQRGGACTLPASRRYSGEDDDEEVDGEEVEDDDDDDGDENNNDEEDKDADDKPITTRTINVTTTMTKATKTTTTMTKSRTTMMKRRTTMTKMALRRR